jgi:predicted Zn finger-like uncharacterized protein
MATGLATRCSACGTVFRVVPDQLRVSEGWVRCGRCSQVFNALEGLVDLETGLPKPAPGSPGRSDAEAASEIDFEIAHPAARPGSPPLAPAVAESTAGKGSKTSASGLADPPVPARGSPGQSWTATPSSSGAASAVGVAEDFSADTRSEYPPNETEVGSEADKPSFVRSAERAQRWRSPKVRAWLAVTAVLATLTLLAQVSLEYRNVLAAHHPETRPWLDQACAHLGCKVEATRSIENLAVDSSGLVRIEKSNLYKLQVTLRNRGAMEVAVPALDITLTDSQGRLMARKVLRLSELGAPQATMAPGRELAVQATVQAAATGEAALQPIAGYTIELFYP